MITRPDLSRFVTTRYGSAPCSPIPHRFAILRAFLSEMKMEEAFEARCDARCV